MARTTRTAAALAMALAASRSLAATIHLCGDSTMARGGGGSGTEGWGEFLQYSFDAADLAVSNSAIGGRSARSYTREGRFGEVAAAVREGDWVVVEFGHNDGGSLTPTDNGRTDCFGDGDETCETVYDGQAETVLTMPAYLRGAARLMLDAGAEGVVLSSQTPNNVWESGEYAWGPSRFDYYAWKAAADLGGPDAGVWHVPHGTYAAQAMRNMGRDAVDAGYPNDHTHTAAALADVMARAFVLGLRCGTSPLGAAAVNSTESLTTTVLGPCIEFNSTVPV